MSLSKISSSARRSIGGGLASSARRSIEVGLASSARRSIGVSLASSARGGIVVGLASSARRSIGVGLASSALGGIGVGLASSARGGIVVGLASFHRGAIGLASSARGGIGISYPAAGSFRGFSSSSSSSSSSKLNSWESYKKFKPSKGVMTACGLMGGFTGLCYCVGTGYNWVLEQSLSSSNKYVDTKLVQFQAFQNTATGVHHEFVRQHNEAAHEMQREIAELRSRILSLEQREFDHRKALLVAVEILSKHQAEQDAAAAAAAAGKVPSQ